MPTPHSTTEHEHNRRQCRAQGVWPLLTSYVVGLLLANRLLTPQLWILPTAATAVSLIISYYTTRLPRALPVWFIVLALGTASYPHALQPAGSNLDPHLNIPSLIISGRVLQIDPQPGRWRMDVAIEELAGVGSNGKRATATGRVRIQVADNNGQPQPGDRICFRSKLRRPRRFGLPGEFDYPRHLANEGIRYTGYLSSGDSIANLGPISTFDPTLTIARWRNKLGRSMASQLSEDSAYLLSLTLGEKTRFSSPQRQRLARLGLSHLFSISGLHLGLLATLLYALFNRLYRRSTTLMLRQPAQLMVPLLTLPWLLFYLLLSGGSLPTLRALLLIALAALVLCRQRHTPPIQLLGLVALLILLMQPLALFSVSFQLSFCGVAALMLCLPSQQKQLKHRWQRWLLLPPLATLVATLATAPIALWHFHLLAPAALLSNLFAIPLIGLLTLPLALCGTLLFALNPAAGLPCLQLAQRLIDGCLHLAERVAVGPFSAHHLYLNNPELLAIAVLCLVILCLIARQRRLATRLAGAAVLMFSIYALLAPTPAALQLIPFSIGQGDSLLLQRFGHENYLIDGGGLYSPTFDVGERLLAPSLGQLGVHHFKAVILTHDHPDHRKGLIYILRYFNVDQFWCSLPVNELHWSLQQVLQERRIPVRIFAAGWITIDEPPTPLSIYAAPQPKNMNDRSLALYAACRNDGLLLTGDLEQAGVSQLLAQPLPGPVQVLKLPHHGSRRSLPDQLLPQLKPQWAIASVGYNNRYGFPHSQVIEAVSRCGAQLIRTDRHGSVKFSSDGNGWRMTPFVPALPQ
ncbi:MAG: DNA internalization-related competence protein ComEC/Rec2 [Desulfuromonas sp.]|nr:DNA internalization-related competence protein ComEC/Rec2 [Desulfuromonas sp.]